MSVRPTSKMANIQRNTFTRWCNVALKHTDTLVTNIFTDFCDGLKLIALLETLSGKKAPGKVYKSITWVSSLHQIANIKVALKFLDELLG